jgi:hypothetical protein
VRIDYRLTFSLHATPFCLDVDLSEVAVGIHCVLDSFLGITFDRSYKLAHHFLTKISYG